MAGKRRPSEDCFGWSACLLYLMRGQQARGRFIPFFQQLARLVSRIASADVPAIFGDILTCGDLVALQAQRDPACAHLLRARWSRPRRRR
jgi:hypothetical protein